MWKRLLIIGVLWVWVANLAAQIHGVVIDADTGEPVPYVLYDSTRQQRKKARYTEAEAKATGTFVPHGYELLATLLHSEDR